MTPPVDPTNGNFILTPAQVNELIRFGGIRTQQLLWEFLDLEPDYSDSYKPNGANSNTNSASVSYNEAAINSSLKLDKSAVEALYVNWAAGKAGIDIKDGQRTDNLNDLLRHLYTNKGYLGTEKDAQGKTIEPENVGMKEIIEFLSHIDGSLGGGRDGKFTKDEAIAWWTNNKASLEKSFGEAKYQDLAKNPEKIFQMLQDLIAVFSTDKSGAQVNSTNSYNAAYNEAAVNSPLQIDQSAIDALWVNWAPSMAGIEMGNIQRSNDLNNLLRHLYNNKGYLGTEKDAEGKTIEPESIGAKEILEFLSHIDGSLGGGRDGVFTKDEIIAWWTNNKAALEKSFGAERYQELAKNPEEIFQMIQDLMAVFSTDKDGAQPAAENTNKTQAYYDEAKVNSPLQIDQSAIDALWTNWTSGSNDLNNLLIHLYKNKGHIGTEKDAEGKTIEPETVGAKEIIEFLSHIDGILGGGRDGKFTKDEVLAWWNGNQTSLQEAFGAERYQELAKNPGLVFKMLEDLLTLFSTDENNPFA